MIAAPMLPHDVISILFDTFRSNKPKLLIYIFFNFIRYIQILREVYDFFTY